MSYAVLEKAKEELDEAQQNAVVMFVRFLVSQKVALKPAAEGRKEKMRRDGWAAFDRIRAKASVDHSGHEWTMDEIDAEIAASRRERRERMQQGAKT